MNTRDPIQRTKLPPVLSVSFSASRKRFATGLHEGLRIFRTDNCLVANSPALPADSGASVVAILDDRYFAFVSHRRDGKAAGPNVVVFWDSLLEREIRRFDLHEPVLGIHLSSLWMVVVLMERAVVFQYQEIEPQIRRAPSPDLSDSDVEGSHRSDQTFKAPNLVYGVYPTARNPYAVASLKNSILALPAVSVGQAQIISMHPSQPGNKRVLSAHQTALRHMALSDDGTLLATTSGKGTLIRVWNIQDHDSLAEVRRGSDNAATYGLAFSPGNRWLASTSDKGTLHIFDLRPPPSEAFTTGTDGSRVRRQRNSSYAAHRLSYERGSSSGMSAAGRSSPSHAQSAAIGTGYQGSMQEYYSLRQQPTSASPPIASPAISAIAAIRASPFAPKLLSDTRSIASASFYMGEDPPHWQGGQAHTWTTTPSGTKRKVANPVLPLPNDPTGRPPKGILGFVPKENGSSDDEGAALYVIGGGSDARWEMFELLPTASDGGVNGWVLRSRGFRRYLTRQFVD